MPALHWTPPPESPPGTSQLERERLAHCVRSPTTPHPRQGHTSHTCTLARGLPFCNAGRHVCHRRPRSAVWPWPRGFTSLGLRLLVCRMGMPTYWVAERLNEMVLVTVPRLVPGGHLAMGIFPSQFLLVSVAAMTTGHTLGGLSKRKLFPSLSCLTKRGPTPIPPESIQTAKHPRGKPSRAGLGKQKLRRPRGPWHLAG